MKEITVNEFVDMQKSETDFAVLDVRMAIEVNEEPFLGALLIVLDKLILGQGLEKLPKKEQKIVVICRSGVRSAHAVKYLAEYGYHNVFNLIGGMIAYQKYLEANTSHDNLNQDMN